MDGRTALVTGAANPSGIGYACAALLARQGGRVVLVDIDGARARAGAEVLCGEGLCACAFTADITDENDVKALVAFATNRFGGVDALVNNAGGSARLLKKQSDFIASQPATWDWVINLNLRAPMLLMHAVLPGMMERRAGKIVNIASIAGVCALGGYADYSAAKGGLIAFSRTLAQEVGPFGINVNCVAPGSIATRGDGPNTLLGRLGRADEVAEMVLYLCCSDSDFVTGQCFSIDGGRSVSCVCK